MATGVEELVDMLFDMIDEAKNAPLSSEKCIIERDKALDLLDDIKAQFPVELAEARKILNARNEYVAAAKREADEIRKRAEIEAGQMVSEDRVMNQARQKANELVAQAEVKAKEVRRAANEYCEDVLRRTEEALSDAHSEMRQVRSRFRLRRGRLHLNALSRRQQPHVRCGGRPVTVGGGRVDIKIFLRPRAGMHRMPARFFLSLKYKILWSWR